MARGRGATPRTVERPQYLRGVLQSVPDASRPVPFATNAASLLIFVIAVVTLAVTFLASPDMRIWAVNAASPVPWVGDRVVDAAGYVPTPNCLRLTGEEALERIGDSSLVPNVPLSRDQSLPRVLVRDQEPPPGRFVPKGSIVTIWVSESLGQSVSEDSRVVWSVVAVSRTEDVVSFLPDNGPIPQVRLHTQFINRSDKTVVLPPLVEDRYVVGAGGRPGLWVAEFSGGTASMPPLLTGGQGWRSPDAPIVLRPGETREVYVRIARGSGDWLQLRLDLGVPSGSFEEPIRVRAP